MQDLPTFLGRVLPKFLQGAALTLEVTAVALALGFATGLAAALLRVYARGWLRGLAVAYIELFRGTPLLVQLFWVYYGLPDMGLTLSPLLTAFLTLGLNSGAYQAEYFRGTIQAVGQGQMLAARSIGMSRWQSIRTIILPQALRLVIPSWTNEAIGMIKYSAVVFTIAVPDLLGQAKLIAARYFNPLQVYSAVTVVYILLVSIVSLAVRWLERRVRLPGMAVEILHR